MMLLSCFPLLLIDFQFKCHVAVLRIREILHKPMSRNAPAMEGTEGQLGFLNLKSGGEFWEMVAAAATAVQLPTAVWLWQARLLLSQESCAASIQGPSVMQPVRRLPGEESHSVPLFPFSQGEGKWAGKRHGAQMGHGCRGEMKSLIQSDWKNQTAALQPKVLYLFCWPPLAF